METKLIDGKQIARDVRAELKEKVKKAVSAGMKAPKLVVILVGEDPASKIYVNNKEKACGWVSMKSETLRMPAETSEEEVLAKISELNADPEVNGILVQLPLPKGLDEQKILLAIDPAKDVDGFHPMNVGKSAVGDASALVSCTPLGIMELLHRSGIQVSGKRCVVAGRSNIVGKPMARLLLADNGTVTVCHSRTQDMDQILKEADIFVAAVGKPKMFRGEQLKDGAVVIDVGIHHLDDGICGDVDTESCMGKVSYITPVPGGVGPMTIAMLLSNTWQAYCTQNNYKAD
ncbi:MAG: bifunctional methylenetetrahydrofolate dehydrogenase/methenyltetrahydrofolate cyclohydrolase FolD [Firmicutes bacterium]|nr:bifunctional methylenetetrahydrofolate dehydrogenase/methenyltetrahydrofolate cyclohydrolase FolD [Bacillota bacterium]MBQ5960417.1 bifunctional methylenetetrahydrofolate dehydrogenase/methenyltetrahydrofolate cyclohydrolase FolD [Bacillota bacterium]